MKYEELVEGIRKSYEKADATGITEHVAVQVNVVGEGEGAFYIEVADGKVHVEPYEYYDRDAIIVSSAERILDIVSGKNDLAAALSDQSIALSGNVDKALLLKDIKVKKPRSRKAAPKAESEAASAPAKKASCKKPAATATAKEVTPATGKAKRACKTAKKG